MRVILDLDGVRTLCRGLKLNAIRPVGNNRKPTGRRSFEPIQLSWNPLADHGAILDWMKLANITNGKKCSIFVFNDDEEQEEVLKVEMENAHITNYTSEVKYDIAGDGEMIEVFEITAEKMKINGIDFPENWTV